MEIWLSNGISDKLKLPVNPQSIGTNDSRNFEDIVLANGDEKTVISGRNLRTYTLDSFFPKVRPHYAEAPVILSPMEHVEKIKKWMDEDKVLLLQVTTTNINEQVTIRSFNWKEVGGAVGDIEYTIELKEYSPVAYDAIKAVTPGSTPSGQRPPSSEPTPKTYTVVGGDSLWTIARKMYGDGAKWPTIYDRNKSVIGANSSLIKPGQVLVIP